MSKTKFTPGPWVARVEYKKSCVSKQVYATCEIFSDDKCLACAYTKRDNMTEAIANTKLIAAAPEMYDILKHYFDLIQRADYGDILAEQKIFEDICYIEGALMKAEGEE